jgi:hypothetical protein
MNTRLLCIALFVCFLLASCFSSRVTTHWVVNNHSDKDVSLNLNVSKSGSGRLKTKMHTIKPGLHELAPETFSKGTYSVLATTTDVSRSSRLHLDSETWVIVSFTNEDSAKIQRMYGYVDTTILKKINGKYTGLDIYNETHKPPMLYTVANHK